MIISASRRTDIPAFYSRWLMNRLHDRFVDIVNPFNPAQRRRIDLSPAAVDAIAFWTRFPAPLLEYLPQIDRLGYPYYFLYTITGYPKPIEPNSPSLDRSINILKRLSDRIGGDKVIWRYDPIVLSSITGLDFHYRNFESIAKRLSGATRTVKISFLDFYKKTERRLRKLSGESGIEWIKSGPPIAFMKILREIAGSRGMAMQSCSEEIDLSSAGISPGSCIDYELINKLFSSNLVYQKDPSQRKACRCGRSVDIGAYNTCGFRCFYCYAISSFETAARNLKDMNPTATFLNPPSDEETDEKAQTPYPASQKDRENSPG
jgi:hypothetical protein